MCFMLILDIGVVLLCINTMCHLWEKLKKAGFCFLFICVDKNGKRMLELGFDVWPDYIILLFKFHFQFLVIKKLYLKTSILIK